MGVACLSSRVCGMPAEGIGAPKENDASTEVDLVYPRILESGLNIIKVQRSDFAVDDSPPSIWSCILSIMWL